MRNHPLTPMTDANLVRVLQAQLATARGDGRAAPRRPRRPPRGRRVERGDRRRASPRCARAASRSRSPTPSPTTTCCASAPRCSDLPLVCAGSGLAIGLPRELRHRAVGRARRRCRAVRGLSRDRLGQLLGGDQRAGRATSSTPAARRAGSIRSRSRRRRRRARRRARALGRAQWASGAERPVLVYSTAAPHDGRRGAGAAPARTTSARASSGCSRRSRAALVERGARRLVVAGGETSGACVQALGVDAAAHRRADRSRRAVVPRRAGARRRTACTWR